MSEGIFYLILIAACIAFGRALILNKYRDDMKINVSGSRLSSTIATLFALKKKHPNAGTALIIASALQVLCLTALAIVLLFRLL